LKNSKPILFIILSRFPFPLEKGDKLRAYYQIKSLSKDYKITLVATSETTVKQKDKDELLKFCKEVYVFKLNRFIQLMQLLFALFTQRPFQISFFYQRNIHRKINKKLQKVKPDYIYSQLVRTAEYVKNYHDCPKTLDYMDAFSKGMQRRIKTSSWIKSYFIREEYRRLLEYERQIFDYFEHQTIISTQDKNYINHSKNQEIQIVGNGVSPFFFETLPIDKKYDLVFTGNMNYPPNIEAAKYIHSEILPLLPSETTCLISGVNPPKSLTHLISHTFNVSGWVDDIRMSYASSKIFIAPMFIGTGLQNKLLEAMAVGIPCITTSLANKALLAEPNSEILIADSSLEFAEQIKLLLSNVQLRENIAINGKIFVQKNYNWENINSVLSNIIKSD
jgi:glycosyltransferase involved in cell wall biosynthesis